MDRDPERTAGVVDDWLAVASARPRLGEIVGDRYRIDAHLGQGGMGLVFAATHTLTERPVALKMIDSDGQRSEELHQRFLSEARTAAAARHPHVVDVLDMGFHRGAPYLVMERLDGEPLDAVLARSGALPPSQALTLLLPIMDALVSLHAKGIAHRDVKPSNVFLSRAPSGRVTPKLLDFGLARVVTRSRFTRAGRLFGTPQYMSPERARGLDRGPSDDVWALAMMTFECVCGALPFAGDSLAVIAAQLAGGSLVPARTVLPSLAPPLGEVLDRSLRRDPAQRYPDVASFAAALVRAAASSGHSVPTLPTLSLLGARLAGRAASAVPPPLPTPPGAPSAARVPSQKRVVAGGPRRWAQWARSKPLAWACAALVVAAVGTSLVVRQGRAAQSLGSAALPSPLPRVSPAPLFVSPSPSVQGIAAQPRVSAAPAVRAADRPARVRRARVRSVKPAAAGARTGDRAVFETEWR
jgi:eukaryotic-like serine/threonine-protein kinase